MRVGKEQIGTHAAHLLERKEPQLVHPVVNQRATDRLRRQHRDQAHQITRKGRPQPGGDTTNRARLRRLHREHAVAHTALHVHPFQHRRHDFDVLVTGAFNRHLSACNRRNHRPASGFDIVTTESLLGAVQPGDAFDAQFRAANPGHTCAHLHQELAQLDHVRLGGGVPDLGLSDG